MLAGVAAAEDGEEPEHRVQAEGHVRPEQGGQGPGEQRGVGS